MYTYSQPFLPISAHTHSFPSVHTPIPSHQCTQPFLPISAHTHSFPSVHTPIPSHHCTQPFLPISAHTHSFPSLLTPAHHAKGTTHIICSSPVLSWLSPHHITGWISDARLLLTDDDEVMGNFSSRVNIQTISQRIRGLSIGGSVVPYCPCSRAPLLACMEPAYEVVPVWQYC